MSTNDKNVDQGVVDFLNELAAVTDESYRAYYEKIASNYETFGNMYQKYQEDVLRNANKKQVAVPAAFSQIPFPAGDKGVDETRGTLPVMPAPKWALSALKAVASTTTTEQQIADAFTDLADAASRIAALFGKLA